MIVPRPTEQQSKAGIAGVYPIHMGVLSFGRSPFWLVLKANQKENSLFLSWGGAALKKRKVTPIFVCFLQGACLHEDSP